MPPAFFDQRTLSRSPFNNLLLRIMLDIQHTFNIFAKLIIYIKILLVNSCGGRVRAKKPRGWGVQEIMKNVSASCRYLCQQSSKRNVIFKNVHVTDKIIFQNENQMSLSYPPTHLHLMLGHRAQYFWKEGGYNRIGRSP